MMTPAERNETKVLAVEKKWQSLIFFCIFIFCLIGINFTKNGEGLINLGYIFCWTLAALSLVSQARLVYQYRKLFRLLDKDDKEYYASKNST